MKIYFLTELELKLQLLIVLESLKIQVQENILVFLSQIKQVCVYQNFSFLALIFQIYQAYSKEKVWLLKKLKFFRVNENKSRKNKIHSFADHGYKAYSKLKTQPWSPYGSEPCRFSGIGFMQNREDTSSCRFRS